ncbi:MAG TPA: hypothetical protein VFN22_07645 [Gemmatimonadales bacterium]|nr:hypothetical protein [Gemmatimonadales bacterium]
MRATADVVALETLLEEQLRDLSRFRHVVEAQRAAARMADSALLDGFSREAEGLAATVSSREVRLLAIRRALQTGPDGREPAELRSLAAQVDRVRALAAAEASALATQMTAGAAQVARELEATSRQLGQVLGGYSRQTGPGQPLLINRRV